MKYLIALFFSLVFSVSAWAQFQKPDVILPSPNAASLGTYGEMKISPFTGLPNIDIPLCTLQESEISLPISLSYHASGFRPDQHPGWTGLNWTLNAGGAITREVKDLPDEHDCPNTPLRSETYFNPWGNSVTLPATITKAGYYFNRALAGGKITADPNWSDPNVLKDLYSPWDTEPDKFSFSFAGYSGTFFLSEKGTWEVQSEQNIKVIFDATNFLDLPLPLQANQTQHYGISCLRGGDNLRSFGGFTLVTEDGTQYSFGGNQVTKSTDAIEYSTSFFLQIVEHWVANSWNLTKIKTVDGKEITFSYEPDSYIANMYVSFLWQRIGMYKGSDAFTCVGDLFISNFGENEQRVSWINPAFASYQGSLIRPVYLASIETTNEQVLFHRDVSTELRYDNNIFLKNSALAREEYTRTFITRACYMSQSENEESDVEWPFLFSVFKTKDKNLLLNKTLIWKKLTRIEVKSKQVPLNGYQYDFRYNDLFTERLMLKAIAKKALNGSVSLPAYEFQYYRPSNVSLPAYLAEAADHWGFYNGNTLKYVTLPRTDGFTHDPTSLLANLANLRKPSQNLPTATLLALRFIKYPTGGTTEFIYEQHAYSQGLNEDRTSLDAYPANPSTGGLRIKKIISSPSDVYTPAHTKEYFYVRGYSPGATGLPSSGILGGQTRYVWEGLNVLTTENDVVDRIAKIIISSQNVLPLSMNSQGQHIGYSEVVEKVEDGSYTIYKYTNFETIEGGSHYDTKALPGAYTDNSPSNPYSDKSFERGLLIAQEAYTSDGQPVQKLKVSYQALSTSRVNCLLYDENYYTCPEGSFRSYMGFPYYRYSYKYRPAKREVYTYDQRDPTKFVLTTTSYPAYTANGQSAKVTTTLSNGAILSTTYKYPFDYNATAMGGVMGQLQTKHVYNRVIEKRVSEDNEVIKGMVNQYDSDGHLVSEYTLETLLPLTSGLTFDPAQINPNAAYYKQRTSYSYDLVTKNLISQQVLGDVKTSYLWGYKQKIVIAEVKNANPDKIRHTSFEEETDAARLSTDSKTGRKSLKVSYTVPLPSAGTYQLTYWRKSTAANSKWELIPETFSGTNKVIGGAGYLIDEVRVFPKGAEMSTYTYDPLVGMTSSTDANNVTTYYEYDGLQRLQYLKDQDGSIVKSYVYHFKN